MNDFAAPFFTTGLDVRRSARTEFIRAGRRGRVAIGVAPVDLRAEVDEGAGDSHYAGGTKRASGKGAPSDGSQPHRCTADDGRNFTRLLHWHSVVGWRAAVCDGPARERCGVLCLSGLRGRTCA